MRSTCSRSGATSPDPRSQHAGSIVPDLAWSLSMPRARRGRSAAASATSEAQAKAAKRQQYSRTIYILEGHDKTEARICPLNRGRPTRAHERGPRAQTDAVSLGGTTTVAPWVSAAS